MASAIPSVAASRPERLRRGADIRAVLHGRRRSAGQYVDVVVRDRHDEDAPRVAVIAGRRVGNATHRNRAKRRLRAAVGQVGMPRGRDAVLIARAGSDTAPFGALVRDVGAVARQRSGGRDG